VTELNKEICKKKRRKKNQVESTTEYHRPYTSLIYQLHLEIDEKTSPEPQAQ